MPEHHDTEQELDLALAAQLQAALLPGSCPSDCPHQMAAARNRMCWRVGGDFHDFLRINADQTAILVGDVVGHGVRAALLMAKIMGFLRSMPPALPRPAQLISALNEILIDLGDKTGSVMPCSIFYAVIDLPTGAGFFVNAGHPSPFLCDSNDGSVRLLTTRNVLLGVEKFEPAEMCHTFTPGQRMVLYTDGILDATNDRQDRFGQDRLHQIVAAGNTQQPQELVDAVFQAVDDFRRGANQNDDETLVVVDRV